MTSMRRPTNGPSSTFSTASSRDANAYGFVADLAADAAIAAGVVDRALVERWRADQRTRARDGTWLVSFTFLATTATAP